MRARGVLTLATLLTAVPSSSAGAQDHDASAHRSFEIGAGGGLGWTSDDPQRFDLATQGQLSGRAAFDLYSLRGEGQIVMADPTHPERSTVRAEGRLLIFALQDFTWRASTAGELIRLQAGFGGDVDLPDHSGHLGLGIGFAMLRWSPASAGLVEAYGAYIGTTLRLHIGPIADELRFSFHAIAPPPQLSLTFSLDDVWASFRFGVTAGNRIYVRALQEGPFSIGPELFVQVEQVLDGTVVWSTLGVSGTIDAT